MEDEAFCIDETGRYIVFIENEKLIFKLIRLPSNQALVEMLRPRYRSTESKLNVAQATDNKQSFKDRIYRDMFIYHMYKANPTRAFAESGMSEE